MHYPALSGENFAVTQSTNTVVINEKQQIKCAADFLVGIKLSVKLKARRHRLMYAARPALDERGLLYYLESLARASVLFRNL